MLNYNSLLKVNSSAKHTEQINHYYPYGGPWGNASTNQGFQPFKYNGKELDRVHGLDWYDYGARRYDPAYCMFTQMDPLAEQYPHLSPYAYCAGNPVNAIDPDGKSIWIVTGDNRLRYQDGSVLDNDTPLNSDEMPLYTQEVVIALNALRLSETGSSLITELQNSSNEFVIQNGIENGFSPSRISTAIANNPEMQGLSACLLGSNGSGGTITWNPTINQGGMQNNHSSTRPPFLGLGHELFHALDANRGNLYLTNNEKDIITGKVYKARYKGLDKTEWRACYGENLIRKELGIPLRIYYESAPPYGPKLINKKGQLLTYPR